MRRTFSNPAIFIFKIFRKTVLIFFIFTILQYLLGWLLTKNLDFFQIIFTWSYVKVKFENFSKTLLFCLFNIFKRTHGTSIPLNYIYFITTTNEWIVRDNYNKTFWRLQNANLEN